MGRILGRLLRSTVLLAWAALAWAQPADPWVQYTGMEGPGRGKHIVLVSGDEEYRSEEALPQLGRILARHHGFTCTVLFAIDPGDGTINPVRNDNIPGLQALQSADLMILFTRFRALPDEQMRHFAAYVESGRPIIGLRTATHAFQYSDSSRSAYRRYDWRSTTWEGGFGRQILGETWVSHHGHHAVQSTRGVIAEGVREHPIVRGCEDIWGPTDAYTVRLPADCQPLVRGQVLTGMQPSDPAFVGEYVRMVGGSRQVRMPNDPMMPIAWIRTRMGPSGTTGRVFATTMGAAVDFQSEGLRRLVVNAAYWCLGMEARIPPEGTSVEVVGRYEPTPFGFGGFRKGIRPTDLAE